MDEPADEFQDPLTGSQQEEADDSEAAAEEAGADEAGTGEHGRDDDDEDEGGGGDDGGEVEGVDEEREDEKLGDEELAATAEPEAHSPADDAVREDDDREDGDPGEKIDPSWQLSEQDLQAAFDENRVDMQPEHENWQEYAIRLVSKDLPVLLRKPCPEEMPKVSQHCKWPRRTSGQLS